MAKKYFALDIDPDCIRWGIVTGEMTLERQGVLEQSFEDAHALIGALAELVRSEGGGASAVCVSVPGTVSYDDCQGTVIGGGRLSYLDGVALAAELSFACGLPVTAENDGKACALGEYAAGALRGSRIGVVLVIGTGIGGGIVVDGRVLRGAHDFAGEFSYIRHAPIVGGSRMRDAMAGLCSWQGLRRSILSAKGLQDDDSIHGHELFAWINAGDDAALRGLHEYAKDLCTWIFNLQCIVDPDAIAISGGISVQPALLEALHVSMRSMMADLQMSQMPKPNIVLAELGADAKLIGAVRSALVR
ncbi:MAG: ROK family protein [Atopobiaceae bacterium]|nr:ROK family protein [Atopobiaceae bacterium]